MGKKEREDSLRVLQGKTVWPKSFRLFDYLKELFLYPYRAHKEKKRQEEIRRSLFRVDEEEALKVAKLLKDEYSSYPEDKITDEN
jgi:hypothetical protein